MKLIQPHLILSGHLHKSFHFMTERKNLWNIRYTRILPQDSEFKQLKFNKDVIHEIVVPTCSYRMGVYNMGYGVAYIGKFIYYFFRETVDGHPSTVTLKHVTGFIEALL